MKKYNLQVLVPVGVNPHIPEGGWHTITFNASKDYAEEEMERLNFRWDERGKERRALRIVDMETGEEIK